MITCRKDIDDLLMNLDYVRIIPAYYEKSIDYSEDIAYLKYQYLDQTINKDSLKNFIVLDTETTGLNPKYKDKVVYLNYKELNELEN